jgi:GH24 family phage-related lysozyme (muramidase)
MKTTLFIAFFALISSLQISQKGIDLIKEFEECKLEAYKCPAGVWTIGYGTTDADYSITKTKIKAGLKISKQQAEKWLRQSVNKKYSPKVNKYNNKYHWTQNEFDAMVSFAYNLGSIDELTANGKRTKKDIAQKMLLYNKAKGKLLPGLTRRRKAEQKLFLSK